ncbi:MAG: D-alanyl-D-alanine carboxypeptidase/D-alanyl-D-alanine-endopeptidase [Bacteroidetes bacterium GWF2_40_14]|nr:MAG: D-alanyl-D-alanine carboxypeptidase/D-alanyl-D-alanine-endopeptidase [Bacteroidetes bacterium GWF2_40_14]
MKRIAVFMLFLTLIAQPVELSAQNNNIQKYINRMKTDSLFRDAVVGIMVMDSKGKMVASWNPDMPLLTASTMKTVTTGLGMKLLGPDFRFVTKIGHTGYVENGVLYGDLFIVGGGDPTLGSKDTVAVPVEKVFEEWTQAISVAGIKRINGSIVADDRFFADETIPSSWAWSNLGPSYGSSASGLSFCENAQFFRFVPGKNIGDKVFLESVYPQVPGMEYKNELVSSDPFTGDRSSYYVSDLAKVGKFKGTMPSGKDSVIVEASNKFANFSCAWEFRKYLAYRGIISDPEIKDAKTYNAPSINELRIICETQSPPLSLIVNVTNRISNNFYAESIFKMIGKKVTGIGSYDSSRVAVLRTLKDMGISPRGYTQVDGSGLSRQNYVSARFFCNYFSKLRESDNFGEFFRSLPQPGGPGTLKSVLGKIETGEKSKIHAKSGSLANVKCYAGYVERGGGEIFTFAILTNNYSAKTAQIQVGVEAFMRELLK